MTYVDSTLMEKLAGTLNRHAAFSELKNPVLVRAARGAVKTGSVAEVLKQYSLLPATIVEFLQIGETRLSRWKEIREELKRNIGEEMGSRTDGQTHYEILKTATARELGLYLSNVKPTACTEKFLHEIRLGLHEQPPPYAAGMLFALEASAIPELTVVARIVNLYAELIGSVEIPITLSEIDWKTGETARRLTEGQYTLNRFFAAHLFDFEVGHKNRLAEAVGKHLGAVHELTGFEQGFESLLCIMGRWWDALADDIRDQEALPLLTVARQRVIALSRETSLLLEP
jgi:hypothetical protein